MKGVYPDDVTGENIGSGGSEAKITKTDQRELRKGTASVGVEREEPLGGHAGGLISLECTLDDMTPEAVAFAMEEILNAGAMDVYTTAIGMKKGRTGVLFTCICREGQREEMVRLMFRHTTTLGIRETTYPRCYALERRTETAATPYGPVRVKHSSGWDTGNDKAEYEDLAEIARRTGRPLKEISREVSEILARDR